MTRRSKIWLFAAGVYAFINVGGLALAGAQGEEMHAMLHLFLLLLGVAGYVGWRLARRGAPEDPLPQSQLAEQRLEYLQQSVDAVALEVERLGEKQRFTEKLQNEKGGTLPPKKAQ
jgi:hypothetical protein